MPPPSCQCRDVFVLMFVFRCSCIPRISGKMFVFSLDQCSGACVLLMSGLVVKVSALRGADRGFHSSLGRGDFSRSSHTSDLKIDHCRISTGTGWPAVSIL